MADTTKYINKIIYGDKTLVDMTGNAPHPALMLYGFRFQLNTGQTVAGTFLKDCPTSFAYQEVIKDSNDEMILDSSGNKVLSKVVYQRT